MGSKPFKTHNRQLKILRNRGLTVSTNGSPKRVLEKYGYYSIINGYKWSFLQRGSDGKPISPEKYIIHSSFDEIQNLYEFDSDLRAYLFSAILKYEAILSADLAYRFSEQHPEDHAYLAIDNYTQDPDQVSDVVRTISSLSGVISRKASQHNAINHYVNKHRHVPLWVLVNFLTFGEFNYFYKILNQNVKILIAKDFSISRKRDYDKVFMPITPETIEAVNHIVNHFRNAVAHGEITFSKRIHKTPNLQPIKSPLNIKKPVLQSQAGVFELILALKLVIPKKSFKSLSRNLKNLISDYQNSFHSISFDTILSDMHFPKNYNDYLE